MSLHDVDVIDYIGVNVLQSRVYLGLFDELDWRDEQAHRLALTKKIDRYIGYIRSGKLLLNYPRVRGFEIAIEYVSTHPMTSSAVEFWKTRERVINDLGFKAHIRGVDVRRSLGIPVEELQQDHSDPVEPPALEVLDPDPLTQVAGVTYLPPLPPRHRKQPLPILRRLAMRHAAM